MAGLEVEVGGAEEFVALARRVRKADKSLRQRLFKAVNQAVKPLRNSIRASAKKVLPAGGGLGKRVARAKITAKRRMSGDDIGVRMLTTSGYDIASMNRGRVRHLVYGRRPWVNQRVPAGFWSTPVEAGVDDVRREIHTVMNQIKTEIEGH